MPARALFERRGVKAGPPATALAARSGLYASERNHHWKWFEFERTRRDSNHGQQDLRVVVQPHNGTENRACHLRSFACFREDCTRLSVRLPDVQGDLSPPTT